MDVRVLRDRESLGWGAAEKAASSIRGALRAHGSARLVAATGASQIEFLNALTKAPGIDWLRVEMFHLDEYIGLPLYHRASFRRYLFERLIYKTGITQYHLLDWEGGIQDVIRRVGLELQSKPVDLSLVGIGEDAHLAFNNPRADFDSEAAYLIVDLDEACRSQQVCEGWFADLSEVPRQAISMSIRQILKAKEIIAVVPDLRKAKAVKTCCEGEISPLVPASILRTHPNATIFLDQQSAALLSSV